MKSDLYFKLCVCVYICFNLITLLSDINKTNAWMLWLNIYHMIAQLNYVLKSDMFFWKWYNSEIIIQTLEKYLYTGQ